MEDRLSLGGVFLATVIALAIGGGLLYLGTRIMDRPVTCGGTVMEAGDLCENRYRGAGSVTKTYDEERQGQWWMGLILTIVGAAVTGITVLSTIASLVSRVMDWRRYRRRLAH